MTEIKYTDSGRVPSSTIKSIEARMKVLTDAANSLNLEDREDILVELGMLDVIHTMLSEGYSSDVFANDPDLQKLLTTFQN